MDSSHQNGDTIVLVPRPPLTKLDYFPEVYAAREKVGVYIPKDRYQQEENERKVEFDMACCFNVSQPEGDSFFSPLK
jgi:hypothetical protein